MSKHFQARIVVEDIFYSDKNERFIVELCSVDGSALTPVSGGYVFNINEQNIPIVYTVESGVIFLTINIPSGTIEEGTHRGGVIYPVTNEGVEYFEIAVTLNFEQSRSV